MPTLPNKEISIAGLYTASMYMWASLCTAFVSLLFYIIGYATAVWGIVDDGPETLSKTTRYIGLWQICRTGQGCRFVGSAELTHAMRAAQAFATLSLLVVLFGFFLNLAYIFLPRVKQDRIIGFILVACHGAAVLLLLITLSIFGARWRDVYRPPLYSTRVGWSMGLVIISLFMELFSAALSAIDVIVIPKLNGPQPATQPQQHQQFPKQFSDVVPPRGDTY